VKSRDARAIPCEDGQGRYRTPDISALRELNPRLSPADNRDRTGIADVPMTRHDAGRTEATLDACATPIAENIGRVARRDLPLNVISP
jgi:hypothetical protein